MLKRLIKLSTRAVLTSAFMRAILKIVNPTALSFRFANGDGSFLISKP